MLSLDRVLQGSYLNVEKAVLPSILKPFPNDEATLPICDALNIVLLSFLTALQKLAVLWLGR